MSGLVLDELGGVAFFLAVRLSTERRTLVGSACGTLVGSGRRNFVASCELSASISGLDERLDVLARGLLSRVMGVAPQAFPSAEISLGREFCSGRDCAFVHVNCFLAVNSILMFDFTGQSLLKTGHNRLLEIAN